MSTIGGTRLRVDGVVVALLLSLAAARTASAADMRPTGTNYTADRGGRPSLTTPAASAAELLQCLLGPDVTVTNAVLVGATQAAGTFVGALGVIGFDQGIILSSGDIGTLAGPNVGDAASTVNLTPGDPDLDALIPGYTTYDAVVLEFDFTCPAAQDVLFQYVFGSEEYNEWVDSPFNDVFGFFLNGTNIARAPAGCSNAGAPVSINHVNCDNPYSGAGPNCNCYRNNDLDDGGGFIDTELDGLTQVFFASGTILPGTNHIKIAIADAGDQVLDSDVMIRCQSFTCGSAPVTGACCLPSGQCITLTNGDCTANGGTYHGDHAPCVPSPCGTAFGACCFPDMSCEVEDPDMCGVNGGIYQGDGTPCVPNPCGAAIGACCYGDGQCVLTDPFGCGGMYMGDWTACDPNPCGDLTGACCADAAICEIQLMSHCGDVFMGVGTTCDPNPCEAIVGACCHDNGTCQVTLEVDCGDLYMGARTVCDPNPCLTAGVPEPPSADALSIRPSPNPSARGTIMLVSGPAGSSARIVVFDASGRVVRQLWQGALSGQAFGVTWDGRDDSGREVPAGVYLLKLTTPAAETTSRVVVAR